MNLKSLINKPAAALKQFYKEWESKSPAAKAAYTTTGVIVTMFNPLIPIVYAGTYILTAKDEASACPGCGTEDCDGSCAQSPDDGVPF